MPTYAYRCPQCDWTDEITKVMSVSDAAESCRQCGTPMTRDYQAENVHTHADSYRHELHSDALAIHPDQRAEHEKLYPGVPLDSACRPVLRNFGQHETYLEARGIVKPSSRKELI
jgi:putative FmdB family regulatory protein